MTVLYQPNQSCVYRFPRAQTVSLLGGGHQTCSFMASWLCLWNENLKSWHECHFWITVQISIDCLYRCKHFEKNCLLRVPPCWLWQSNDADGILYIECKHEIYTSLWQFIHSNSLCKNTFSRLYSMSCTKITLSNDGGAFQLNAMQTACYLVYENFEAHVSV